MPAAGGTETEEGDARPSMAALITRLRKLLQDTAKTVWTDDADLQEVLDEDHRDDWRYLALEGAQTIAPGGQVQYLDFYAPQSVGGNWEDDVQLVDASYNVLNPSAANLIAGRWTFAAQPSGLIVCITGKSYDLYGAAADLLEWDLARNRRRDVDMADASGASVKRSQASENTRDLIQQYRSRQKCRSAQASRSDVRGRWDTGR